MLLQRLSEYAQLIGMPPPMYQNVSIRYIIRLDKDAHNPNVVDCASSNNKRGIVKIAPDCKRSSAIKPKLLADNAEYTLGISQEESDMKRVQAQHASFVALVKDCATVTCEPTIKAIAHFFDTLNLSQLNLADDFDPGANITFEVDGVHPIDLPSVQNYWAKKAIASSDAQSMQCLVCGETSLPIKRLPISIKGIPGGQQTGMALISANASAFESYGLEASLIAPTCEGCGQRFGNGLNTLLSQQDTHLVVSSLAYIFWTRESAPFSIASMLSQADPEDVKQFLKSPWHGKSEAAYLDTTPFYAAALSASGARVVVRDWIETTLGEVSGNLKRYFTLQRLIDWSGEERWFPIWQLVGATIRKGGKEEPAPQVGQALLHVALHGGSLPVWLLYQVIRRVRAGQEVQLAQAALIKMILLSQQTISGFHYAGSSDRASPNIERGHDMAELDPSCSDAAYLCGRLLAELEAIQYAALGDISSTIVDRYYGTASAAPASIFGRLLRGAQPHLAKLHRDKPGAFFRLDNELQEILSRLNKFPSTLDLISQGRFALGFYHQKAADSKARRAASKNKSPASEVSNLLQDDSSSTTGVGQSGESHPQVE